MGRCSPDGRGEEDESSGFSEAHLRQVQGDPSAWPSSGHLREPAPQAASGLRRQEHRGWLVLLV